MGTQEWVDAGLRALDILISWPTVFLVLAWVFRSQFSGTARWLGSQIERREVRLTRQGFEFGQLVIAPSSDEVPPGAPPDLAARLSEALGELAAAREALRDAIPRDVAAVAIFEEALRFAGLRMGTLFVIRGDVPGSELRVEHPPTGKSALTFALLGQAERGWVLSSRIDDWNLAAQRMRESGYPCPDPPFTPAEFHHIARSQSIRVGP